MTIETCPQTSVPYNGPKPRTFGGVAAVVIGTSGMLTDGVALATVDETLVAVHGSTTLECSSGAL